MAITGVEDTEKLTVAQVANFGEGGVTSCCLAGANDLVLG
jgi:hypothetical protein